MGGRPEAQRGHQSIHSPHSYYFYLFAFNNKRDFFPSCHSVSEPGQCEEAEYPLLKWKPRSQISRKNAVADQAHESSWQTKRSSSGELCLFLPCSPCFSLRSTVPGGGLQWGGCPAILTGETTETNIQMGPSGPLHVFLYSSFFLFSLLSLSLILDVEDNKGTLRPRMESKGSNWWFNRSRSKARHTQAHSC